jgi:hypothetical protein
MVGHPAVIAEAWRDGVGVHPQLRPHGELSLVVYRRPRVYIDRDGWEMLPGGGVLVMQVRPTSSEAFSLALTPDELAGVFGEVRNTRSWEEARCYHFPRVPAAAHRFRVARR